MAERATPEAVSQDNERGFVFVWFAIVLVVMLGIAAFAVDLVHAYAAAQHLQNATDAAALAGAVELPNGTASARTRACELLRDNFEGADPCAGSPTNRFPLVDVRRDGTVQNQMDVDAKVRVDTFFARILGVDQITVRKSAQAQYDPPLAMGSPANNYGDIPPGSCPGDSNPAAKGLSCASTPANADQSLWAQIMGKGTTKGNGNSFTTDNCSANTDGCSGSVNNDYKDATASERFSIVQDSDNAPIDVYVYDAGYVDVGVQPDTTNGIVRTCTVNWAPAPTIANAQTYTFDPGFPSPPPAQQNKYCAGDTNLSGSGSDENLETQYTMYAPDRTPSPFDNNVSASCGTTTVPAISVATNGTVWDPSNPAAQYFENWVKVCQIPDGGRKGTEWVLDVSAPRSDAKGVNNFSVMALHGNNPGTLQVMSRARMPLFAAKPSGSTGASTFYLARVLPSTGRVRTLQVGFFDLGDTQGGLSSTGMLRVKAKNPGNFPDGVKDCDVTSPVTGDSLSTPFGPSTDPPGDAWGDMSPDADCSFGYDATWNRQWVSVNVPIPSNYNCDTDDPTDCWIQLTVDPNGSKEVLFDATTWSAKMLGSPVRLVR